jgi:hypothetical protein
LTPELPQPVKCAPKPIFEIALEELLECSSWNILLRYIIYCELLYST